MPPERIEIHFSPSPVWKLTGDMGWIVTGTNGEASLFDRKSGNVLEQFQPGARIGYGEVRLQ